MISHEWFPYELSYLLVKKWVSHVLIWVLLGMISHSAPWVKKFACPHMISHEWFPYKFSYLLMKKWVSHVLIWVLRAWFLIPHHEQRNLHVLIWFLIHDFHMSFSYSLMKICFSYPHMSSHAMRTHWEMRCFRAHRELIWELIMRSMRPFLYGYTSCRNF